jgi:hypothetical protein
MILFKLLLTSRFHILLITGLFFAMTGLISCEKDPVEPGDCDVVPTYTADIKPILDASCAKSGCHDAITAQNGVNLSTYATASAISQEARFLGVIQHKAGFPQMPFDGPKLPQSQIDLLTCWAQNDAPQ